MPNGLPATRTDHAHETLRQNAIERRHKVIWIDTHVQESSKHVHDVVRVNAGEHEVSRQRRLNRDLCGFDVSNLADHDLVRVVTKNGAQAAGKRQAFLFVYGNLGDPANLVLDGILDGEDL